jgi:hypothetical protein
MNTTISFGPGSAGDFGWSAVGMIEPAFFFSAIKPRWQAS